MRGLNEVHSLPALWPSLSPMNVFRIDDKRAMAGHYDLRGIIVGVVTLNQDVDSFGVLEYLGATGDERIESISSKGSAGAGWRGTEKERLLEDGGIIDEGFGVLANALAGEEGDYVEMSENAFEQFDCIQDTVHRCCVHA